MALSEFQTRDALRKATDWLMVCELPGSAAAREGIAIIIPLVVMGEITPVDIDELASIVEGQGQSVRDTNVPVEVHVAQLKEAVTAAFEFVKNG